jgi:hypothetical protein
MKDDDLIAPIRTRGAIRFRGGQAEEKAAPAPVRTRGAIRVRGGAAPALPSPTQRLLDLETLLRESSEEVGNLPLTILIVGWSSRSARAFLNALVSVVHPRDAIWLVAREGEAGQPPPAELESAVMLDLRRPIDRRTFENLVGDIVFLPALDAAEGDLLRGSQRRGCCVIASQEGPYREARVREARDARLRTCVWSGGQTLTEVS